MPISDLGYRGWQGRLLPRWTLWCVIAEVGVRLTWRSRWLRRILWFAWLPAVYFGVGFFIFENAIKQASSAPLVVTLAPYFRAVPQFQGLQESLSSLQEKDISRARHLFWAWLLWTFFRMPQGVMMIILVGLVAPNLIAQDLRSKAYLLYFSRPIGVWEYLLGKALVVWLYLALITLVPALGLYLLGVSLSPDLSVLRHTWDLPLRIVAGSLVLMVPTACVALCFSSLTTESRYAAFAWSAVCFGGWIAHQILTARDVAGAGLESLSAASGRWAFLSLYHMLGHVQNAIFGFEADRYVVLTSALVLATATFLSLAVLHYRVTAPLRV